MSSSSREFKSIDSESEPSILDSKSLLERARVPKGKLSLLNPIWLDGDLYGELYASSSIIHLNPSCRNLLIIYGIDIQNNQTGERIFHPLPSYGLAVFNWPNNNDDRDLFATLHTDQIIIWDATHLGSIEQHDNFKFQLKMRSTERIFQVEVFPGNKQLAIATYREGSTTSRALHLVDIKNPDKPHQEKFDLADEYSWKRNFGFKSPAEVLIKFHILDATHIVLFNCFVLFNCWNHNILSSHLRIRFWELNFNSKFLSWRRSDTIQDTTHKITYTPNMVLHSSHQGKFLAIKDSSFRLQESRLLIFTLVNYKYIPLACKIESARPIGFTSDHFLVAYEPSSYETYTINPVTGKVIEIIHAKKTPTMLSSHCLMLHRMGQRESDTFEIGEDHHTPLITKQLADALPMFSLDLVNEVFSFVHKRAHISLFRTVPAKVTVEKKLADFENKLKLLPEEQRKLKETQHNLQALAMLTSNAKKCMPPLENVIDVQCNYPLISKALKDLFEEFMSTDRISLEYKKSLQAKH